MNLRAGGRYRTRDGREAVVLRVVIRKGLRGPYRFSGWVGETPVSWAECGKQWLSEETPLDLVSEIDPVPEPSPQPPTIDPDGLDPMTNYEFAGLVWVLSWFAVVICAARLWDWTGAFLALAVLLIRVAEFKRHQ